MIIMEIGVILAWLMVAACWLVVIPLIVVELHRYAKAVEAFEQRTRVLVEAARRRDEN
jgi:hypothetical protein